MIYENAKEKAQYFLDRIAPACDRVEIVGSVKRRDRREVHDIEILLIPKDKRPTLVFGRPDLVFGNLFEKVLFDLQEEGLLKNSSVHPLNGPKLKNRVICGVGGINEFRIEFYIVNAQTWGIQNVIRTGPALFSHRFVTNKRQTLVVRETVGNVQAGQEFKGFLPNHLDYIKGETIIKHGEKVLHLPEERDAIDLIGAGWIPPEARGRYAETK